MEATKTHVFLVSLSLVLSLFPYKSTAAAPKYTVSISNYLGKDSAPATIHCYSSPPVRDNPVTVIQWGQAYVWDFRTALGLQSRFTCDISSGSKHHGKFVIFDVNRDKSRCTSDRVCFWRLYPDGLYFFVAPSNSYEKQCNW